MKLIERTSAPTIDTKYYKTNNPFYDAGYGMFQNGGNCTDYAYFRYKEANSLDKCDLPPWQAEVWFEEPMPYAKGQVPKIGSVIVWAKGKVGGKYHDGDGHVAFVERVNYDSNGNVVSIVISESGWKSFLWQRRTLYPPFNTWTGYTLLGFIYSPNEFEVEIPKATTYSKTEFIKDVQRATGAKVDGIAGPETLSKTVTISKTKNRYHAVVKPVQQYLLAQGYELPDYGADGDFGSETDKAVRKYQADHNCVFDGEITARCNTWKSLLGLR